MAETASYVQREPVVVFLGSLAGLVALGIAAATALDWVDLSAEQATAVVAFVAAATAAIGAVLHGAVYCPDTVAQLTAARRKPTLPDEFA